MKSQAAKVEFDAFAVKGQNYSVLITDLKPEDEISIQLNGKKQSIDFSAEENYTYTANLVEESSIAVQVNEKKWEQTVNPIPLWLSILPPLIAILLALLIKEVVSSILIGIYSGALIINFYVHGILVGWIYAFMRTVDTYLLGALNNKGHLSIILFSLLIGAMVSLISKNGGMQGVVNRISKYAQSPKSGQLATWFLGIAIFFDDYANTLIVGNTMRPITDKLKISREKLAYLVDSTAAPIASIAFVTTWIGAELGYISSGIEKIDGLDEGVYSTFINSLAYSFYPILALLFMLMLILKGRDFGPMLKAEINARKGERKTEISENLAEHAALEEFAAKKDIKPKAFNAIVPVLVVIFGTIAGLLFTGWDTSVWNDESLGLGRKLSSIIGQADSYQSLLWSSLAGLGTAIKLSVFQGILSLSEAVASAITGIKTMLSAIVILVLAWALALVIEELHTAELITSLMSENISPYFIPALTFVLAALIAFSTGSSWGTMAILYPLILPATWKICQETGLDYDTTLSIFHNVVSTVLAGAVLGDHCSPISDTTILSSLSSSCNHIDHVKTQMPYALTVGAVALLFGTIPSAYGLPMWLCLFISLAILYGIVQLKGKATN
jgi:Na+/H+ antiporter NhaC